MIREPELRTLERLGVLAIAVAATLAAAWIGRDVLDGIPHVSDEVSYLFQARVLASGSVTLDPPPLPALFRVEHVILDDVRWCSKYPPGWPVVLAVGVLVGHDRLVNPVLLGLAVLGVWWLGRLTHDRATGVLAAALLAVSPFAVLMAAGRMSHPSCLAASIGCLIAVVRAERSEGPWPAVLAGMLGGLAFLIRPVSAVALLAPAVSWCIVRRRGRGPGRLVAAMAIGFVPALIALLVYQSAAFGSPLQTGYGLYDAGERFSGVDGTYLTFAGRIVRNLPWYIGRLTEGPWGWPWPDWLPLLALLMWRPRRSLGGMLAACAGSLVAVHLAYYYRDVVYGGPRFAYEALGPASILVAGALLQIVSRLRAIPTPAGARVGAALGVSIVVASLAWPALVGAPATIAAHRGAYHGQTVEPLSPDGGARPGPDALVFVAAEPFAYGSWFTRNGVPPPDGAPLYVRDEPALRVQAVEAFARSETWQLYFEFSDAGIATDLNGYTDNFRVERFSWNRAGPIADR